MRTVWSQLLVVCLLAVPLSSPAHAADERWVVYYGDKLSAKAFENYDVIVFDADNHPPLRPLQHRGKTLLGYISLGEAESYRHYYKELQKEGLLLSAKKNWKGHHFVDVRRPEWTQRAIERLIPAILHQGFDGIMVDTIDSPIYLEEEDPKKYAGMREASANMLRAIRQHYPEMKIMLNRGLEMLPEVAGSIDMVLAESIYVNAEPDSKKKPELFKPEAFQASVEQLRAGQKVNPALKVYTLDYWPVKDAAGVKSVYAAQRAQGFIPYVSVFDLQSVHPEP